MENLPEDRPITCRDTTWLVSAARDGELDEAGHAALQKHIADCPFCREASQQFTDLFRSLDLLLAKDHPK